MTTALNIVAFAPNPWDGQWTNRQHLLSRLGQRHRVVYSAGAWSMWERREPAYEASSWSSTFSDKDDVLIDRPGRNILRWARFRTWDRVAVRLHARHLTSRLTARAPLVAHLCHPAFWPYVQALQPDHIVYHCYDLYDLQPNWNAAYAAAEKQLLSAADLVFSPTQMLSDNLMARAPCHARTLPNAADVHSIFAAAEQDVPIPPDLAAIPQPRIGYVGSIHPQLDLDLVADLARRRPEWNIVLIGPEQSPEVLHGTAGYRACRARPNIHLLGERHRGQIAAYLLHMNANVMVYKATADSWTHVAYPLKLHEYLACGLPVVSVDLKSIREFSSLISFVEGPDAWEAALASAIDEQSPDKRQARRAIAAKHSWEARVGVLDAWLGELAQLRATRLARTGVAQAAESRHELA